MLARVSSIQIKYYTNWSFGSKQGFLTIWVGNAASGMLFLSF